MRKFRLSLLSFPFFHYFCSMIINEKTQCSMIINEKTLHFIREHADEDVRKVALAGAKDPEVDLPLALQQIAGRQTARKKLPSWAMNEGVVYPPHLNMEQCSSEQTARYKAIIAGKGEKMVDLTGGFGVDFYWMSQGFGQRQYVEQDATLCAIAEGNMRALGLPCAVCCCDTATYLTGMESASLIYLDPARRNEHGGRTYGIEDCTPNVVELLPVLLEKADRVIIKLSPMLDWREAVKHLKCVSEVHIVSVDNECKELVVEMRNNANSIRVVCVNLLSNGGQQVFEFGAFALGGQSISHSSLLISHFLYEPNASIMKAGCFGELAQRYGVSPVAANTHLFLSPDEIGDFPGRRFQITAISSMNKKELSKNLVPLKRANIAVRNFPMSAEQLRKRLKLQDGGDTYIFAATSDGGEHLLFICRKIG